MANYDKTFELTDAKMKELAEMMEVSGLFILDREGKILAKSEKPEAEFTYPRYTQLRTVFTTGEPSEAFEVNIGGTVRRYYGAKINEEQQAVIAQDPEELHLLQDDTSSWRSILGKIKVGLNGFTFAVSNQDYTFLYYPDDEIIGKDSLDLGLKAEDLADNNFAWMTIGEERFFCGVKLIPNDDAFVICAVPESEITSSRNITVAVVLFVFLAVLMAVGVYSILILKEQEKTGKAEWVHAFGKFYYNKVVGKKLVAFSVVGLVLIVVVSFHMQTLFSLSFCSMSNNRQVQEVGETLKKNEEDMKLVTSQYNQRYLNKCKTASYILSENHQLWTKEDLARLSEAIGAEFLLIFDKDGNEVVSDSTYVNFSISNNPEDQSYEFINLLQGLEYVIQEAQPDQISGVYRQYIGVLLKNEQGDADGFVEMSVIPDKLESALKTTTLTSVLDGVKASAGGFAFAVDKETQTFVYYPEERLVGKSALEYGMQEKQFRDGYCDYITIDNQRYFVSSLETDKNYIYVAVPQNRLMSTRIPVAVASGVASLVCLLFIFLLLAFSRPETVSEEAKELSKNKETGPMVDVMMPDGTVKKSEAAANRWSNSGIRWRDRTPEQKLMTILEVMMGIFSLAICIAVLYKDKFFETGSIFRYIIEGKWERGLNVFAFTGCILIICVGTVITLVLQEILQILSRAMNAKGATLCHLVRNLIKYLFLIGMLYYCFALFGVDTQTLLASAGILSLIIGLGAQKLVSDILAGLFIIFEGEFQVGDIVTIGDWRGTVQEIGVRTTKIIDPNENVKIISNSAVSGVVNMTKRNSYCLCDLAFTLTEEVTLERIEGILEQEMPALKKDLPEILGGPTYNGIYSLSGSNINIKLSAECNEGDKALLGRKLTRQIKVIFDRYGITLNSVTCS